MTALTRYQKLESPGVWHQSPESPRRNVHVSLGEATLVITDKSDMALSHWSLAAVVRINSGATPAIYAPGPDDDERLELTDPLMIEAIDTVRRALVRRGPRGGAVRALVSFCLLAGAVAAGVLWLPDALVTHTAEVLPDATRQELGSRLLQAMAPYDGEVCTDDEGAQALRSLQIRLFGTRSPWDLRVVPKGPAVITPLPGGVVLIGDALLSQANGPDAVAGHLIAATLRAELYNSTQDLLAHAGLIATVQLLTTGSISDGAIETEAHWLANQHDQPPLPVDTLIDRFRTAEVSAHDYGMTAVPGGAPWQAVIDADPFPKGSPKPLLTDDNWLRLQGICD